MRKLTSLLLVLLLSVGSYAAPEKNKPMPWPESVAAYKAKATKGLKATAESPVMKARQDAQKLTVDVTGAENLMLVTSATPDGNSNDHAVWANRIFVAKKLHIPNIKSKIPSIKIAPLFLIFQISQQFF